MVKAEMELLIKQNQRESPQIEEQGICFFPRMLMAATYRQRETERDRERERERERESGNDRCGKNGIWR